MMKYMKKMFIAGAMVAASSAVSACDEISFIVGADYQQTFMKSKSSVRVNDAFVDFSAVNPKSFPGAQVYVGAKFHEHWGTELGFDFMKKSRTMPAMTGKTQMRGAHLDAKGYLSATEGFALVGSVGVGLVQAQEEATGQLSVKSKKSLLPRVGVGAEHVVRDRVGLRVMVRWQGSSAVYFKDATNAKYKPFKNATSLALGVFAKF
jgi:hypothetical protein